MLLTMMTSWKRFKWLFVLLVLAMLYLVVLQHSVVHLSVSDSLSPDQSAPDAGHIRQQQVAPTCGHLTTVTSLVSGHLDVGRKTIWPNSTSRRRHQTDGLMGMMMMVVAAASADDGRLMFNCSNVDRIKIRHKLGRGVTKQVYLGTVNNTLVAVKMVTTTVLDVINCVKDQRSKQRSPIKSQMCYAFPNMKLMKEILMMQQLRHRNIVRMLGFCVRSEQTESTSLRDHGVIAVYQYGSRFDVKSLMSSSPRQRLGTALEMAELLHYLQHSPLGSLRLSDFKEAHLLLTDGHVKLIDLDDWTSAEPSCRMDGRRSGHVCQYGLQCVSGVCSGYNAKHNLDQMNRILFSNLLSVGDGRRLDTGVSKELLAIQHDLDLLAIDAGSLIGRLQKVLQREMFKL